MHPSPLTAQFSTDSILKYSGLSSINQWTFFVDFWWAYGSGELIRSYFYFKVWGKEHLCDLILVPHTLSSVVKRRVESLLSPMLRNFFIAFIHPLGVVLCCTSMSERSWVATLPVHWEDNPAAYCFDFPEVLPPVLGSLQPQMTLGGLPQVLAPAGFGLPHPQTSVR